MTVQTYEIDLARERVFLIDEKGKRDGRFMWIWRLEDHTGESVLNSDSAKGRVVSSDPERRSLYAIARDELIERGLIKEKL